jgi:hypothetical protein
MSLTVPREALGDSVRLVRLDQLYRSNPNRKRAWHSDICCQWSPVSRSRQLLDHRSMATSSISPATPYPCAVTVE